MTPYADMVRDLLAAVLPHDAVVRAVAAAENAAAVVLSSEIPPDDRLARIRAADRKRKAAKRSVQRNPPEAGHKPGGGRIDFCWLVFDRAYSGEAEVRWLHREKRRAS
jgi:hypothetical protein